MSERPLTDAAPSGARGGPEAPAGPRSSPSLGGATLLAALWILVPAIAGFALLARLGAVGDWLRARQGAGAAIFLAAFAITSGLGLLPTYAQAFLGGWVFGLALGLPLSLGGFLGGALIGYVVSRLVTGESIEARIAAHPQASVVRRALVGSGFLRTLGTVTLVRLPPNSPFALMNLALSGAGAKLPSYLLGTLLGMTPRTAVIVAFAAAGSASGSRDIQEFIGRTPWWQTVAGIASVLVVLFILGAVSRRALRRAGLAGESTRPGG